MATRVKPVSSRSASYVVFAISISCKPHVDPLDPPRFFHVRFVCHNLPEEGATTATPSTSPSFLTSTSRDPYIPDLLDTNPTRVPAVAGWLKHDETPASSCWGPSVRRRLAIHLGREIQAWPLSPEQTRGLIHFAQRCGEDVVGMPSAVRTFFCCLWSSCLEKGYSAKTWHSLFNSVWQSKRSRSILAARLNYF